MEILSGAKVSRYDISVYEVFGRGTSSHVMRSVDDYRLHSDLNGVLDILRRGSRVPVEGNLRQLSFVVDHNGVVPALANGTASARR